jgi:sec-independent protein translocase protein TatB
MFDLSFGELMLIGVVALIVIGPERLPKVARTVGHLVGRAQRYVSDVKSDIQREINLGELNNIKGQMEDAAKSMQQSMQDTAGSLREPLDEARKAIGSLPSTLDAGNSTETAGEPAKGSAPASAPDAAVAAEPAKQAPAPSGDQADAPAPSQQPSDKAGSST